MNNACTAVTFGGINMKDRYSFIAVFYSDDDGVSIEFPDLPGCFTEGDTLEEAYEMAQDAMGLYMVNENGEFVFPTPTDIKSIVPKENEYPLLVEFDPVEYLKSVSTKSVKKTLTIPEWLNTIAEKNNINFSQLLQNALKEQLQVS